MEKSSKIYVAGHSGMVGGAIVRKLRSSGYEKLILRTHHELDLCDQTAVEKFFASEKPECVVLSAAKVGGIKANMTYPAEFLYENLQIQNNVIWSAFKNKVRKLVFLGSSCVYPRNSPQPMKESYFMDGKVEPTNEGYAIAKIAGMELCRFLKKQYGVDFISCMPSNIYGVGDHFDPESSHVVSALIMKFYNAKEKNEGQVSVWGTGSARREFLYVDDLADAVLFLLQTDSRDLKLDDENFFVNVGAGTDISIKELAELIAKIVGYNGKIVWDTTKPDGMPRKLVDVTRLRKSGWKHKIDLEEGIQKTYEWYLNKINK